MITAALHDLLATILQQCDGAEFTVSQRTRLAQLHGTATADLEQVVALLVPLENNVAATGALRG